jgi:hypothetical protein
MNRRRFMLLAIALVAVNTFFWVAQGGFALPGAVINQFFGPSMVRAEVLLKNGEDWRIDRGVVTSATATSLTLREADGTTVTLDISPTARIQGAARITNVGQLKKRLRVVVYHQANLPAAVVQVEGPGS